MMEDIQKQLELSYTNQQKQEEAWSVANIKENTKFFFTYANKMLKNRSGVGPLDYQQWRSYK